MRNLEALALIKELFDIIARLKFGSIFPCFYGVNGVRVDLFELSCFILDVKTLVLFVVVISFLLCLYSANGATHRLAGEVVSLGSCKTYFVSPSSSSSCEVGRDFFCIDLVFFCL